MGNNVEERVAQFAINWQRLSGKIMRQDLQETLGEALSRALKVICTGVPEPAAIIAWEPFVQDLARTVRLDCQVEWIGRRASRANSIAAMAYADIGINVAQWAVADTGSVALYATPEATLYPSLLPKQHLVLLDVADILPTVREGLMELRKHLPQLAKIITGPSMSADIEGQLQIGVHGPQSVMVLLWESDRN